MVLSVELKTELTNFGSSKISSGREVVSVFVYERTSATKTLTINCINSTIDGESTKRGEWSMRLAEDAMSTVVLDPLAGSDLLDVELLEHSENLTIILGTLWGVSHLIQEGDKSTDVSTLSSPEEGVADAVLAFKEEYSLS